MFKKRIFLAFKIVAILTVLFTFYRMVLYLNKNFSQPYSSILFVSISFVIISPFIGVIRRSLIYRLFGVLTTEGINTIDKEYKIEVNNIGRPVITSTREIILTTKNATFKDYQLFDLFSVDRKVSIDQINWKSADAKEIRRQKRGKNKIIIFWEPKDKIHILSPYKHTFQWTALTNYNDPANYFDIYPENPSGHIKVSIETRQNIQSCVAFKIKRLFKNDNERYKYALALKKPECPQPLVEGKTIKWDMKGPQVGTIYTICFFYENGFQGY